MPSLRTAWSFLIVATFLVAQSAGLHFHAQDADHHEHAAVVDAATHRHDTAPAHQTTFHAVTIDHDDLSHVMTAVHAGVDAFGGGAQQEWSPFLLLFLIVSVLLFASANARPLLPGQLVPLRAERHWRPPLRAPPR